MVKFNLRDKQGNERRYDVNFNIDWVVEDDVVEEEEEEPYVSNFTAKITDIDEYGLVTIKFSKYVENRMFNVTNKTRSEYPNFIKDKKRLL